MAKNNKMKLDKQNLSLILAVLAFAIAGIALLKASSAAPLAKNANCNVTGSAVGAVLPVTGTGYAANTTYRLIYTWPAGAGSAATATTSDTAGNLNYPGLYANWHGTYSVQVQSTNSSSKTLATCSTTIQ